MLPEGTVIGVVHLLPLPGSPRYGGSMKRVIDRAVEDARAYVSGGVGDLIVENYGDTPFHKDRVPPETVAAMTRCAAAVSEIGEIILGINVLRNDARSALAIAAAVGAGFIRVNVHAGVMATDQGLIEGRAADTLRARAVLGGTIAVVADAHVKHGTPLGNESLVQAARDLHLRAGADALVVSGAATGSATATDDLRAVRKALPRATLFAGSGVRRDTVAEVLTVADAVIVGTALKRGGKTTDPVDPERVKAFVEAARKG